MSPVRYNNKLVLNQTIKDRLSNRMNIISELTRSIRALEKIKEFAKLIPEVRVNFAYAIENPKQVKDVAAVDGRITVVDKHPKASGKIKYGASDHLARILIEIAKYDKCIRSAINFKFSKEIMSAVQKFSNKNSLIIGKIDRKNEPRRTQSKDGESIQWKVKYMYEICNSKIPRIFYENEGWGKEPLFVVTGITPNQVLQTIKSILKEF